MYVCVCVRARARKICPCKNSRRIFLSRVSSRFDKAAAPITTQEIHVDAESLISNTRRASRKLRSRTREIFTGAIGYLARKSRDNLLDGRFFFPLSRLIETLLWFPAKEKILGSSPFSPEERQPRLGTDFEFSRRQGPRDDTDSRASSIPSRLCRLYKIITDRIPKMFPKFPWRPRVPLFMQLNQT